MFKVIAGWRERREDTVIATCRQEAIRLAKRIVTLDAEFVDNRKALDAAVADAAPELCDFPASALWWPPACSWRGLTQAGSAPKRRSLLWQEPARSRPPRETLCGTGSTAAGTAA